MFGTVCHVIQLIFHLLNRSSILYVLCTYPESALALLTEVCNYCYCTMRNFDSVLFHFLIVQFQLV